MDDVDCYGEKSLTANLFIYCILDRIAIYFKEFIVKRRATRFTTAEYTIFTNYLDSHIWFDDAELNRWFEAWRAG